MVSVQPVIGYINHWLRSNGPHGVHSPFVYELITKVFRQANLPAQASSIEKLRKDLLRDKRLLNINDLGAGTRTGQHATKRTVKQLTATAAHPKKHCAMFYNLVKHLQYKHILELGTSMGISSAYLAMATPAGNVTTIEGCPEIHAQATDNFKRLGVQNITALQGAFAERLPDALVTMPHVDICYIDGDHRAEPTLGYLNTIMPHLHINSVVVFDDIHWSRDMEQAWAKIVAMPEFSVTLDLYHFGMAFLRTDQAKQHFRIKF